MEFYGLVYGQKIMCETLAVGIECLKYDAVKGQVLLNPNPVLKNKHIT